MHPLLAPRRWGGHVVALVLVTIALALGAWQLDQWREARAAAAQDLSQAEPVPLDQALGPDEAFQQDAVGQPVTLSGTWLPESTVLVSDREVDGVEGWWVATPVAVGGGDGSALYVVRGWTADRDDVPPAPQGETSLVATLQPPEGSGAVDPSPGDDELPQLRTADLVQQVDQDLYGGYAVLVDAAASPGGPAAAAGLEPAALEQLPAAGASTALRNVLYALEWVLFGMFAAFVWWRWTRDVVQADRAADGGGDDRGGDDGDGGDGGGGDGGEGDGDGGEPGDGPRPASRRPVASSP
ncbi:SURF1 family cytochrome oxidase biogenesis protein [Nocardioides perillae]|uniref:SURF1-like protein n=1 Tax=Nocardioides perillae TaxID=1119534 RepID=A0A7Y9UUX2_9ACTN|nr:cytochrome oxidase assembly protein ShyY1 [Nocardioides perillae]